MRSEGEQLTPLKGDKSPGQYQHFDTVETYNVTVEQTGTECRLVRVVV